MVHYSYLDRNVLTLLCEIGSVFAIVRLVVQCLSNVVVQNSLDGALAENNENL